MTATATQEVVFNVTGQSFAFDCEDGRPTAVLSVAVRHAYADDTVDPEDATVGSASIESDPVTELTAAAGALEPNPTALAVTSGTGFAVGRRYEIVEDSSGVREWFETAGVNGLTITTKHPLRNVYSAGAVVRTTRCTMPIADAWVSDMSNISPAYSPNPDYRVRWEVTLNGSTAVYERSADLVRYPTRHGVTPLDVDRAHPGWIDQLPPDFQIDQGRSLIDAAFASVKFELYGDAKADQAIRNPELVARLVIQRCPYELLLKNAMRGAANESALAVGQVVWRQIYDQTIRSPVAPFDEAGGGAAQPVPVTALWRR